jgi:hypothetical protein
MEGRNNEEGIQNYGRDNELRNRAVGKVFAVSISFGIIRA